MIVRVTNCPECPFHLDGHDHPDRCLHPAKTGDGVQQPFLINHSGPCPLRKEPTTIWAEPEDPIDD